MGCIGVCSATILIFLTTLGSARHLIESELFPPSSALTSRSREVVCVSLVSSDAFENPGDKWCLGMLGFFIFNSRPFSFYNKRSANIFIVPHSQPLPRQSHNSPKEAPSCDKQELFNSDMKSNLVYSI